MAEPDRPQSPFAGMADLSARTPLRVLSPDEIERLLAEHRLYLATEYHQGQVARRSAGARVHKGTVCDRLPTRRSLMGAPPPPPLPLLNGVILIQRTIHYPFGDFRRRHEFELTVAGESLSTTGRALLHIAIRCVILTW